MYTKFKKEATIPDRDDVSLADFLKNYLAINGKWYKKTNFNASAVGLTYNYTNIGAALAAYLIEIKSNLPFDTFCATYIFEPLQLKATRWKLDATTVPKHVQIYNTKKEPYPLYSAITYPDGNLKTSCEDLSQYLISMIKGYKGNGNLLSKASFATLFKKQFSDNQLPQGYDKKEPNSGIFWRIKSNGQIGHTGSDVGVTTFLFFNPETGFGKLFMTNIEFDGPNDNANKKLIQQFIAVWKKLEEYEK